MERKKMLNLKFNTKIYKMKAIQEAILAYSDRAKFSLSNDKRYIQVRINRVDSEIKAIIGDEFANYVLGLTKKWIQ